MQPSGGVNTINIENGVTLSIPRHMSNIGSRAFKYAAPRLYNNLPIELRKINKIDIFKKRLKALLFSRCYDSDNFEVNEDYAV